LFHAFFVPDWTEDQVLPTLQDDDAEGGAPVMCGAPPTVPSGRCAGVDDFQNFQPSPRATALVAPNAARRNANRMIEFMYSLLPTWVCLTWPVSCPPMGAGVSQKRRATSRAIAGAANGRLRRRIRGDARRDGG
jgi:hypothetical protein